MNLITYDLETYPNIFTSCFLLEDSDQYFIFELSDRKNQIPELINFLYYLKQHNVKMQGYNNVKFDNEILEYILRNPYGLTALILHQLANQIIKSQDSAQPYRPTWYENRTLTQIDLMAINGFDRKARRTSLKHLQFNMRCESVEDLPFPLRDLTFEEMDTLTLYMVHDTFTTRQFGRLNKPAIAMRMDLMTLKTIDGDALNMADQSIGEKYIEKQLGKNKTRYKGKPIQTHRSEINFKTVVLPNCYFKNSEYDQVLQWYKSLIIRPSKKTKPKFKTEINGVEYKFGLGGIHGSVKKSSFHSNDEYEIIDIDVSGMYPAIAIVNKFYPEHLGEQFVKIYAEIPKQRKIHGKKTSLGKLFKLAANAVFGKSGDLWSFLFDLLFLYRITINGQLQLWRLVESLNGIPKLKIIQANTDGITAYVPKDLMWLFDDIKDKWQIEVGLELEEVRYKSMWVRDVNNYLSLKYDGSTKGKGAYFYPKTMDDYEGFWYKDYSMMVVPKCTEYCLINNVKPEDVIRCFVDKFDYMILHKSSKSIKVTLNGDIQPKTLRCYISKAGGDLVKHMDAKGPIGEWKRRNGIDDEYYNSVKSELAEGEWDERIHTSNRSKYDLRESSLEKGYLVKQCQHVKQFDWGDLDYEYYICEVNKLIEGFNHV